MEFIWIYHDFYLIWHWSLITDHEHKCMNFHWSWFQIGLVIKSWLAFWFTQKSIRTTFFLVHSSVDPFTPNNKSFEFMNFLHNKYFSENIFLLFENICIYDAFFKLFFFVFGVMSIVLCIWLSLPKRYSRNKLFYCFRWTKLKYFICYCIIIIPL